MASLRKTGDKKKNLWLVPLYRSGLREDYMSLFSKKKQATRPKAKKLTQKEIISHIEQLASGESVGYRVPDAPDSQVAIVEFSTEYPWKGSRYRLSMQSPPDGKAEGEKELVSESNEARDLAIWLSERRGKLLNLAE